jgi:hypothetical protein
MPILQQLSRPYKSGFIANPQSNKGLESYSDRQSEEIL